MTDTFPGSDSFLGAVYALTAALCWAVAVNLFKRGAEEVPPAALNLFKSCLALAVFAPILLLGQWGLESQQIAPLLCSGVVGISIADTLFFWALGRITASQLALMDCLYSPVMVLFSTLLLNEQVGLGDWLGGSLIVMSILFAVPRSSQGGARVPQSRLGMLAAAAAIALMGLSIVMVKPIVEDHDIVETTAVRLLGACVGIVFLMGLRSLLSWVRRSELNYRELRAVWALFTPQPLWRTLIPAALLGNCVSLYLWVGGYKYLEAHTAALLNQMSTPLIVVVAILFFGEKLTGRTAGAIGVALCGCLLVLY